MDTRRGCSTTPNKERWLFVGRDLCYPLSLKHEGDLGALFNEVKRVVLLKVMALIVLDDLYRRNSNHQAAAMMAIQVMKIQTPAATIEILARPSREHSSTNKQSQWSDLDEQRLQVPRRTQYVCAKNMAGLRVE
jgi:hypothetical protein